MGSSLSPVGQFGLSHGVGISFFILMHRNFIVVHLDGDYAEVGLLGVGRRHVVAMIEE